MNQIDLVEYENYMRLRNTYKLFCVGCVIFLTGFLFIYFGVPYTFDRTNKDLFFVFGLLFMIPGGLITLGASYLLWKLWQIANDFVELNKPQPFPEDLVSSMAAEPTKDESLIPPESLVGYTKFGLDPNEPI